MIYRETVWTTEAGEPTQYAFAVLNDVWEPLYEQTLPCGPFHDVADRRLVAHDDWRRYLARVGVPLELELG